jgi:hypothetical protein
MKKKNELQQAVDFTMQNAISIIENLGETTGLTPIKPSFIFKKLETNKIETANESASQMHGAYIFRFFEKDEQVLIKITGKNSCYILPANNDCLITMKKQIVRAWGQCKEEDSIIKQKEELKQEQSKSVRRERKKEAKKDNNCRLFIDKYSLNLPQLPKSNNMIDLILTSENFDLIASGQKKEEYRAISNYYIKKLCTIENGEFNPREDIKEIRFRKGYTQQTLIVEIKGIYIDTFENFIPENFKRGDTVFTIELGKIIVDNLVDKKLQTV